MNAPQNQPIDPRIRLAIIQWPQDAPRGAVTTFCIEHDISRKTFYELRKRARLEGGDAALEPRSRRPRSSPRKTPHDDIQSALKVRRTLEESGLDHGPISVHDRMLDLGIPAPSPATLARAFRQEGVARLEPSKKPRSSWKRFVYPAPNECWQIDAMDWPLACGRRCVIFQVIDDHSRFQVASLAARSENGKDALRVVRIAIERHGAPRRFLSDNGSALNPSRRGMSSPLLEHLISLGIIPITGKPYKPTTQGKNERSHRTLAQWLSKQPMAETLQDLQTQLDEFEHIYNTQRHHQALPGRMTPSEAWNATDKAAPPAVPQLADLPLPTEFAKRPRAEGRRSSIQDSGTVIRKVNGVGLVILRGIAIFVGAAWTTEHVRLAWDTDLLNILTLEGEMLITYRSPTNAGTDPNNRYIGKQTALMIHPRLDGLSPMS